jgi:ribosomal protein L11 methyltransferase
MSWRQFVMHLDDLDPEPVEEIFLRCGAGSVELSDAADDPVLEPGPGETPLWPRTQITGLFSADADFRHLKEILLEELGISVLPMHRTEDLADRQWEREWLKSFGPMQFGKRLMIYPTTWPTETVDAVIVRLDPGLAFGTGTHATTALCLEWLDSLELSGKTLLDYGCGSGVLAIAGLKLGCRRATAMDIDPQAIIASQRNAQDNTVADCLTVCIRPDEIKGQFDVVVANILADPLVQFAESITSTLHHGGMLALSGVLCEQANGVVAAFERWIEFDEPVFRAQDGQTWSRLTGRKR